MKEKDLSTLGLTIPTNISLYLNLYCLGLSTDEVRVDRSKVVRTLIQKWFLTIRKEPHANEELLLGKLLEKFQRQWQDEKERVQKIYTAEDMEAAFKFYLLQVKSNLIGVIKKEYLDYIVNNLKR